MRKTRLVALLLAVAMIATLIIPSVAATPVACPVHTEVTTWTEVAEGTWTGGAIAEGHYKLTGNQNITSALTVAGNVCIDLAGYNITAGADADNNYRVFEVTGVLTIDDSAETDGVISGGYWESAPAADEKIYGGNILVTGSGAKLNLYGGTISGGYMKAKSYRFHPYGGNVALTDYAVLNMYGGTIKDGEIVMNQQATQYHGGGNIYADTATVNIQGGTVSGGSVTARYSSATADPRKAYGVGGNIAVKGGSFCMSGGLVDDGNLDVLCKATNGTADVNATAHAHGGNVYCIDSRVILTYNAVVSNGTLSGEAIAANGGEAGLEAHGGNLYIKNSDLAAFDGNAQILDGEVVGNFTSARGGNLYVASGVVSMMDNVVLSGGTCNTNNARGGNAFVLGQFNINGGTIKDGSAGWGANLMLQAGATINLENATITGGTGDESVLVQRGTFNMASGSIETVGDMYALSVQGTNDTNGGKAYISGGVVGNVFMNRASLLEVSGGTVGAATLLHTATLDIKAGATVTKMWEAAETATVTVAEGVICQGFNPALNGVEGFEAYRMHKDTGVTQYVLFTKLATALAAAESGNTVSLMSDVTADEVLVPAGVTLNLYGKTLTANVVNAAFAGAQIKDEKSSKNAGGKLICNDVSYNEDNVAAPIYYEGAYHFQKFVVAEKQEGETFKFYISDATADILLDEVWANGYANTGLELHVVMTWKENGVPASKTVKVPSDLIEQYVADWDNKMFIMTIVGDMTNVTELACTARVAVA